MNDYFIVTYIEIVYINKNDEYCDNAMLLVSHEQRFFPVEEWVNMKESHIEAEKNKIYGQRFNKIVLYHCNHWLDESYKNLYYEKILKKYPDVKEFITLYKCTKVR